MNDSVIAEVIRLIRDYTAFKAWIIEVLLVFVVFTLGRFAVAVWLGPPDAEAAAYAYSGSDPLWWTRWLYAYDNLRGYADDGLVAGLLFGIIFEGGIMFLARKRIALSKKEGLEQGITIGREAGREEGREAGREEGREAGRVEGIRIGEARSEERIRELEERVRELERRPAG